MADTPAKQRRGFAKYFRRWLRVESVFILGAILIVVSLVNLVYGSHAEEKEAGETHVTVEQTSQQTLYKSLDLSQARTATYSSPAVQQAQSFGNSGGAHRILVKFKVPKDNLTEYGMMTLPLSPAPAHGYPVIVMCHGYANPSHYSTTSDLLADMEFYSRAGFAVIKPDFRGQGFSSSAGKAEGAYYSMAYNTDVLSLIAAIKQTSYLNKNDINLWGQSLGAYIALRAAVLEPDIRNLILLSGPVGNFKDMYTKFNPFSDRNNPVAAAVERQQLARHGTPLTNPTFWAKTSPLNYLNYMHAFVQIHVGSKDTVIPPFFSAGLNSALTKLNKPHAYYIYRGGKHNLIPERPVIWQRSLKQLNSVDQNSLGFAI